MSNISISLKATKIGNALKLLNFVVPCRKNNNIRVNCCSVAFAAGGNNSTSQLNVCFTFNYVFITDFIDRNVKFWSCNEKFIDRHNCSRKSLQTLICQLGNLRNKFQELFLSHTIYVLIIIVTQNNSLINMII